MRGAQSALFGSDAMAGVIQMFTRAGARRRAAGDGRRSKAGPSAPRARRAGAAGASRRASTTRSAPRDFTTNNDVPNNEFDNTTLSGSAGVPLGAAATLRFTGRAELGDVGTPGQTAFGRPDLDAFFQRRNGVGGVTFAQTLTPAFTQRATYALAVVAPDVHEPRARPALHAVVRRTASRRSSSSTSPTTAATSCAGTTPPIRRTGGCPARPGRRHAPDDASRSTGTASAGCSTTGWRTRRRRLAQQRRLDAAAPGAVVAGVRHRRPARRAQRQLRHGGRRRAARWRTSRAGRAAPSATRRLKARAGRGIKEPTLLQSFSPSPFFLGNPDARARAVAQRRRRHRAAAARRPRPRRADAGSTTATGTSSRPRRSASIPFTSQYFNIGLTRARGAELSGELAPVSGVLVARRLHAARLARSSTARRRSATVFAAGPVAASAGRGTRATSGWRGRHDRLSADLTGVFVGRRVDSDFSSLEPPMLSNDGYATWDVRAAFRLVGPALDHWRRRQPHRRRLHGSARLSGARRGRSGIGARVRLLSRAVEARPE